MRPGRDFDHVLDVCVDRLNRGESIDACLADYPEHARELEPLLRAVRRTRTGHWFEPSRATRAAARQRFETALQGARSGHVRPGPSPLARLFSRPLAWATAASVLLVAVVVYVLVGSALPGWTPWPGSGSGAHGPPTAGESAGPKQEPPDSTAGTSVTVQPSADGSFVFLISDEVNAIGDFDSLIIDIASIGLKMEDGVENGDGPWVGLQPETSQVDLARLQGDLAQQVWRGDIPDGLYSNVFIEVSEVTGILKGAGNTIDVKLPGDRLHLSSPFEVTSNMTTHFVYDLTVVAAGGPSGRDRYILRPQVGQSGVGRPFRRVEPASGEGQPLEPPGAGASGGKAGQPEHDRGGKALGGPDNGTPGHVVDSESGPLAVQGSGYGRTETYEENRATRGAGRGTTHKPCHWLLCLAVWRRWRSQFREGCLCGWGWC